VETKTAPRMKVAHRFAKNLFWLSSAQFFSLVLGFFTVVYIARALGDTAFGQIALAQALLTYLLLITDFGFTTKAISLIAKDRDRTAELAGLIVALRLLLALVAVAGTMVGLLLMPGSEAKKLTILLFALTVPSSVFDLGWIWAAHEKMRQAGCLQLFRSAITFLLAIAILPFSARVQTAGGIYLVAYGSAAALNLFCYRRSFGALRLRFAWRPIKQFLLQALPLGLSLFMIRIYYSSDTFILSYFHGDQVVGWYNAGYKIVNVLIMIAGYYGSVLLPTLSHQIALSAESARNLMHHSFRVLLAAALPFLIGGIFFANDFMAMIFGASYINGAAPLRLLLVATVIIFAGVVFTNGFIAFEMQRMLFGLVSAAAAINVVLNFIMIPSLGMVGAALTTTLAQCIVVAGGVYALRSHVAVDYIRQIALKTILAAALMALAMWLLRSLNVFLAIAGSTLTYIVSLLALGVLRRSDWAQLIGLVKFRQSRTAVSEL
jgi:O-antigen/teichoic acid export membrane protein